jgi:hypothetical protein
MERVFAMPPGGGAQGIEVFRAPVQRAATPVRPLEVPVTVPPRALGPLAVWDGRAAGEELLHVARGRVDQTPMPRVIAIIRNIAVTGDRTTMFRVFLNAENVSAATPATDASYVGTFGFFGGTSHEGHGPENPSVMVDLTDAIGRLHAPHMPLPERLMVQVVPVPIQGASAADAGTAQPEAVEVVVVPA